MNKKRLNCWTKGAIVTSLLLGAGSGLFGQDAATQPDASTKALQAASSSSSDDETITLSPFEVYSSKDRGYTATSTLAGTRLRTDLRDVGAAISAVTKNFIQDTGVTNAGTLLTYLPDTEVAGVHGNFSGFGNSGTISENYINPQSTTRVRGLDNADNTRGYFLSSIPWDAFNIDRVDAVRGPNAILYGLGSPAGIINTTLNEAEFRNFTNVEFRWGRFSSGRVSLDTNQVVVPQQLAIRLDAEYSATHYQQKPSFNKDNRQYIALKFTPKFLNNDVVSTMIKVNDERGTINSNNPEQSPPDDLITPWFNPKEANKFVSDPMADWTANGLGPTLSTHGVINTNPATAVPTGKGQTSYTDGSVNPYYQPWMGTMGFQGGTTLLTGVGATTPGGLTFWQPQLGIGSYASVNGHAINGIPYNQVNGVSGYALYAQHANLPYWQAGLYKDRYLTDPTVFDFYNNMIEGDNARQWQRWNAGSISIEQNFFNNRFGYQLAGHQEQYHSGQWSLFGGPGSINIVTDAYNVDGTPNANFGKPFITGNGHYSNFSTDEQRTDIRFTAYGELRGRDFFAPDSMMARMFGVQRFTGMLSADKDYRENKSWALFATDPSYNALYNQGQTQIQNLLNYTPNIVSFLGSSMANATTASGAFLNYASKITMPTQGATEQWIAKWTAPSSVDPAATWTNAAGATLTNADNPANYQGWTTVPVHVLSAFNGDINQLYTGGQKEQTQVSSKSFVWQGFFADGDIVPLVGIRKDTVRTAYAQPNITANGTYDLLDPNYRIGSAAVESGITRTYSVVLHVPKRIMAKLPLDMDLSVFFNQSQNFQPGGGRVDVYGNAIADPSGKTHDAGVGIGFLGQKIVFKVNHFDTRISNASMNGLSTWDLGASVLWNWEFDQFYKNSYGQSWQNAFLPINGQTAEQAAAQQAAAVAAVDQMATDPLVQKFIKAWKVTNSGTSWQTVGGSYNPPAGFAQTQDTESKGWEYELTANVTNNWTVTANASRATATTSNIGGTALNEWVNHWNSLMQGPAGDIRLWWGGSTTTSRSDFTGTFMSGWSLAQLGAGADVSELRPWHFNLVSNYYFSRTFLKGLNIGGAYRWSSRDVLGYPTTLDSNNVYHFDLTHPFYGRKETAVDLWTGYDFKPGKKTKWHVQLNVRNAFASKQLIPITVEPDGTPAAYKIPEPLDWQLTVRVSF
ncbi:ferrichrome-iron receptor precursor [mine drainage metagenome]|uniref:Ferrichrome-iron receptor n=1 Tax=mine drainage metagenome TaxID=410659 RepID=A0A1J5T7V8_9ZZZZ